MAPASLRSTIHNQSGPLWCWFPSGWACARPRPLRVSPTTSPVRLGVSPAATPTPRGVFNQRFEALFPRVGALGCSVCFASCRSSGLSVRKCGATGCYLPLCLPRSPPLLSPALWVYLCKCRVAGSASAWTACPVRPTLRQSQSRHGHVSPLHPGVHLRPSYRSG